MYEDIKDDMPSPELAEGLECLAPEMQKKYRSNPNSDWLGASAAIDEENIKSFKIIIYEQPMLAVSLVCLLLLTGAATVAVRGLAAINEATAVRARLEALHEASGLREAFQPNFEAMSPNVSLISVTFDPEFVSSIAVSYDDTKRGEPV